MSGNRRRRFNVDDLFTDTRPQAVGVNDLVDAKEIRIDRIEPDPRQPRTEMDEASLAELAASIQAEGVLQPIAVRYNEERDRYVIIHGERRWRASRMAGLASIPCIVRDVPDERVLLQQLMENIVREDLNALDRAAALRALKEQLGDAPWEQVARAVGIRRSRLFQLLGTEKLSPTFQRALREGRISEKQTRSVQRLPEEIQEELGRRVIEGVIAGAQIDRAARSLLGSTTVEEARSALRSFEASERAQSPTEREAARLRRPARQLRRALDQYDGNLPDDVRGELRELRDRIDTLLDASS